MRAEILLKLPFVTLQKPVGKLLVQLHVMPHELVWIVVKSL